MYWRSLVAWSPVLLAPVLMALVLPLHERYAHGDRPVAVQPSPSVRVTAQAEKDTNVIAAVETPAAQPAVPGSVAVSIPAANAARKAAPVPDDSDTEGLILLGLSVALLSIVPTIWSLRLRGRSLQDRIAGTTLVPR